MCLHMNPYSSFYLYLSYSRYALTSSLFISLYLILYLSEKNRLARHSKGNEIWPSAFGPLLSHTQNHNDSTCRPGFQCANVFACMCRRVYMRAFVSAYNTLTGLCLYVPVCDSHFLSFWHFTARQTRPSNELRLEIKSTACTHLAKAF